MPTPLCARLGELKIARRGLTGTPVRLNLEGDLLAFDEAAQTGSFERADMDEHVLPAVIRLNEAIALLTIIPFYDTHIHGEVLSLAMHKAAAPDRARRSSNFGER